MDNFNLTDWDNDNNFTQNYRVFQSEVNEAKHFLEQMIQIRCVEEKLAEEKKKGSIGGPVHLCIGQEAIPVGISLSLNKNDNIFGAHRSHGHILALGSDKKSLFAEILGKKTGLSKGMGGSMHLIDNNVGFRGSVPIVSGTVSLALGCALAEKIKKSRNIAVAYLGDGAIEEGVVHECLNFSVVNKVPILFVVENNFFSSHLHISLRQNRKSVSRFAEANGIHYKVVDGNNVLDVSRIAKKMIESMRSDAQPFFLEAVTYRLIGHVDWRIDVDVGVQRSKKDIEIWKKRDPIDRLKKSLINHKFLTLEEYDYTYNNIVNDVKNTWIEAENEPYPDNDATLKHVFFQDKKL